MARSHWSQAAFAANTTGAKKLKSAAGKDSVVGIPERGGADSHTDGRTHSQARSRIHARRLTRADTRTHSDAHLLVSRPSGAPLVCGGEGRRPLRSAHKQASLGLLAPTKLFFFVAVNFPGPRVYLFPKLNPVTKPNLKRWNNQCRLLQSMAPCASWN